MADEPELEPEDHDDDDTLPWESAAIAGLQEAVDSAEFDEEEGVVRLTLDGSEEEFSDIEDVLHRLGDWANSEIVARVPFEGGSPVFSVNGDDLAYTALEGSTVSEFLEARLEDRSTEQLLSPNELGDPCGIVRVDLENINQELIRYLAKHPELIRDLSPFKFEDLVAELFRDLGYDVVPTPRSKDGGFDFRAFRKDPTGTILTMGLVECKQYRSRKVGVEVVRALVGVLDTEEATNGVIVTSSFFTRGAKAEQSQRKYRVSLGDYDVLMRWLQSYKRPKG
jgi:hypothetical protein